MAKWTAEAAEALSQAQKNKSLEELKKEQPRRLSLADLERLYDHG